MTERSLALQNKNSTLYFGECGAVSRTEYKSILFL